VRAYPTSQGGGDTGGVFTMELQHLFYEGLQTMVFFDGGFVRQYKNANTYTTMVTPNTSNANNNYYLMGGGLGAKYGWHGLNLSASIAWPIGINPLYVYSSGAQRYLKANADDTSGHPYAWLQLSYNY
jgi:hemolysin activation/secretion protein